MSFVSYESYTQNALHGPGMTLDKLFKIGDIVDANIINRHIADMPPLHCDSNMVQFGEQYSFSRNDNGAVQPCYITFAFEDNDWVFKGACFEHSLDNKCNLFNLAEPSVGKFCVDKFYSEYVRAADKLLDDKAKGINVDDLSVIDNYMHFNAFSLAGYWLDAHGEDALEAFKEAWVDNKENKVYEPVVKLIERRNEPFKSIILTRQVQEHHQEFANVSDLIAKAKVRSEEINSVLNEKTDKDYDI